MSLSKNTIFRTREKKPTFLPSTINNCYHSNTQMHHHQNKLLSKAPTLTYFSTIKHSNFPGIHINQGGCFEHSHLSAYRECAADLSIDYEGGGGRRRHFHHHPRDRLNEWRAAASCIWQTAVGRSKCFRPPNSSIQCVFGYWKVTSEQKKLRLMRREQRANGGDQA